MTTIVAGERRVSGRRRKEPDRRGARIYRRAVQIARRAALTLALAAAALVIVGHVVGWSALIVRSGSMEPAVPVGSLVLARPVGPGDVRVGDVIAVRRQGGAGPVTVLHRVHALEERGGRPFAELKGDANAVSDPQPAPLDRTVVRSVAVVPVAGYVIASVREPAHILLIVVGVLGLVLIWGGPRGPINGAVGKQWVEYAGTVRQSLLLRRPR